MHRNIIVPSPTPRPRRELLLKVRASAADIEAWTAAAEGRGSLSGWVRASLHLVAACPDAPDEVRRTLKDLKKDLGGVANNLNQAVAKLHTDGTPPGDHLVARVGNQVAKTRRTLDRLRRKVRPPRRPGEE